ncbi:homoserine O-succinyltransferase [Shewanella sp. OPT22]|nr:homoserine O-succinyltransferase [Shewanella sp. OPT22]
MPVRIPDRLPATQVLASENIFVMSESRAMHQDIRPLKILILNLMPNKIETETQLLRLLGNTPLQVEVDLLRIHNRESRHTPIEHMESFYFNFSQIKNNKYDGMLFTGAPLGRLDFESVQYWTCIKEVMDWSQKNVTSVMFFCWAAHAALFHLYGVKRKVLEEKRVGVFKHKTLKQHEPLMRGFDEEFYVPHSRSAEVDINNIYDNSNLCLLASSDTAGAYLVSSKSKRNIFVFGHPEYQKNTLKDEYLRDTAKGEQIPFPQGYFPDDNIEREPKVNWYGHGNLLMSNWLNYYVYQMTPYKL